VHEVNVIAPWHLITLAEPHLRRGDASPCIVNIASHAGVRPKGASIPYAVSKAGLVHMTKLLAVSLAPAIRVNAIAPGLVDTPMTADWAAAQTLWRERAPMRRAARPEDIADVVGMLVASKYITGEIVMADGGLNLT
jgi:NAD(P)-dependent dehydrogenase (short-subunit alcohol dehydrogenase family)